jgi:hypothetical protein|nr:MAG TPA: hypothetical protein [Caudoviricetes sp.]
MISESAYELLKYIETQQYTIKDDCFRQTAAYKDVAEQASKLDAGSRLIADLWDSGCIMPIGAANEYKHTAEALRLADVGRAEMEQVDSSRRDDKRASATLAIAIAALLASVADIVLRVVGIL